MRPSAIVRPKPVFAMAFIREWSWRLAILALPWQTRWFAEGPALGGLPWEQGRWAFYLSYIPLGITVLMACLEPFKPADHPLSKRAWAGIVGVFLVTLSACFSIYPQASFQWLVQLSVLSLFAWALLHLKVDRLSLVAWSVIAIVPEAVLAIGQFLGQRVIGSEFLGMSSQLPATPGVSVVEEGGRRILRAYGGLPHPNILGGWLAYGLALLTSEAIALGKRWNAYAVQGIAALMAVALVLTFSRSAWIAAALAVTAAGIMAWRKAWTLEDKIRLFSLFTVIVLSVGVLGVLVHEIVIVRATSGTRLEELSTNERLDSIAHAWTLVLRHPTLGTGPNTGIFALDRAGFGIIPPHFTFLLILLETGFVGLLGVLILVGRWIWSVRMGALIPLLIIVPAGLLDHYLWSLWAGQCLVMLAAVIPLTERRK